MNMCTENENIETQNKPGGYISKLQFNNGESLDILQNDIVVFVGPNNSGKSQSLKDIFTLCYRKDPSVVISDITITKNSSLLKPFLESIANVTKSGNYTNYQIFNFHANWTDNMQQSFMEDPVYGNMFNLFVANLNTDARLTICDPPQCIARDGVKQHPIHYAAFNTKPRKWLSDNFKKAFDEYVTPNTQFGLNIPLCIGEPVKLNGEFADEQERQEEYARRLAEYKQVHNQGDGIRSFTGILLYLMLDYYCTYLIDEPESFLHPPQANIMGRIIGETLTNQQQAFISTHSEEIIKGLLTVCPERIKLIRITREGNINSFSILNNINFSVVWNDPLLKYSNIMASLFHKSVVLCESDSDCKFYSIIDDNIKRVAGKYSETMFIHCGGKHRMAKIVTALKALNIDVKLIPDFDVINDQTVFKGIIEAFKIEWINISSDYNIVVSNLHSPKEKIKRDDFKSYADRILCSSKSKELSNSEIISLNEALKTISKWAVLKENGIMALPHGDATIAFGRINRTLQENGIYIVPVGELECFVKEVGGHGPEWVNKVLESYPNLNDTVYNRIKEFISSINL